jgi:hypothetical protein
VAYYGNPRAPALGVLGQGTPTQMIARLRGEVAAWQSADQTTAAVCAFELIVTTAQASAGKDGLFRARMGDDLIGQVISSARRSGCITIFDIQVGRSTVSAELPRLVRWLAEPDVHLALDPEWAMGPNRIPGKAIGSMDAIDINAASALLSSLAAQGSIPPKVLIVHRFTRAMVTRPELIRRDPGVQLVINMDGFGAPSKKRDSYRVAKLGVADPVMGLKLFYKNDVPRLTPAEALTFEPKPVFINYQ